jgi:hypothetical protein
MRLWKCHGCEKLFFPFLYCKKCLLHRCKKCHEDLRWHTKDDKKVSKKIAKLLYKYGNEFYEPGDRISKENVEEFIKYLRINKKIKKHSLKIKK